MPRDTIAFISTYEHPSRDSVEQTVRQAFPEYRLENIVVNDLVKQHRGWMPPNLAYVALEYGGRIARGGASIRDAYFWTTYLFRRIHRAMREVIDPARHVFSFQTQSMYDTSVPGVPHFLYTDHTHLSNLRSEFFDRRNLRPPRWLALERTIYDNAARVFTRSHNVREDLLDQYGLPPVKVACVYAGANVNVPDRVELVNDDYANQRILFVGGDWERKGGPDLVQAFQRVLRVFPQAHLTIAGARPELTALPNCTVVGAVPLGELGAYFARSSIFCVPTRLEPFGIAFLEAMLHRLPVVATTEGALPDMVNDGVTGRLVPPGGVEQLAEALIELLGDPARCRQLGEAGHRLARERYTWPAVGARLRAEILPLIGRPASS
ncbi:MAG TPA: glycosyltransferase family 4 protein [Steroidobacteraceae bacterium]|jgi:glycosyltransferase involved in cell wall biosynthesis|nr:glycosyltransferase family 4 protein [Steroidobacteraceae bacterium]